MKNTYIPACYFPSTIVFVDDNQGYLNSLSLILEDNLSYSMFESPKLALAAIQARQGSSHIAEKVLKRDETEFDCPISGHTLHLNLNAIYQEVYNPKRFAEISVVVADYAMPQMNGLEYFKEIHHLPVQKIMLTGQADESIAVQAFNDGIIDKFILKSHPEVGELLNHTISELQYKYFQLFTESVVNSLTAEAACCLNDPFFAEFFQRIIRDRKIVEYYLAQAPGTFLLLDSQGHVSWLIVKTAADLQMYKELATEYSAPSSVIEDLNHARKFPHFWNPRHFYNVTGHAWETFMIDATKLQGQKQDYYYAIVNDQPASDVDPSRITSYAEFLTNY
ncbi:MAG: response regulator [Legionellales bacterium]|nr:response regulator [Legionellales bacterium]